MIAAGEVYLGSDDYRECPKLVAVVAADIHLVHDFPVVLAIFRDIHPKAAVLPSRHSLDDRQDNILTLETAAHCTGPALARWSQSSSASLLLERGETHPYKRRVRMRIWRRWDTSLIFLEA